MVAGRRGVSATGDRSQDASRILSSLDLTVSARSGSADGPVFLR